MIPRMNQKTVISFAVIMIATVAAAAFAACSSESSSLGQYRQGRTLHFSVVSLERVPELRYSTVDPEGVIRRWSLSASSDEMELVLIRAKVQNHTAVSAFVNVDSNAASLRDFTNETYRPLSVSQNVWQDFRGDSEAMVRMNLGQCFDGTRALVDTGASVMWRNEADQPQYLAFEDTGVAIGPGGRAEISPGESLTHSFNQPGIYPYHCGDADAVDWPAELQVATPLSGVDFLERSTLFLNGSFELVQGHGVDGFIVFEAPKGTEFRDIRWQAGDSILFRF
jgi:plastocyanin